MNNFKTKTIVILTTFAIFAHYAPAMEANIVETRLKRKQQEDLDWKQDDFKKQKFISQIDQNGETSVVTLIANQFGLNAEQRRDLEARLTECLRCNMSEATLTSRLKQRARHLKKLENQENIEVIYTDSIININNQMELSFSKKNEIDFNHNSNVNNSNLIFIDIPITIKNKNVDKKLNVQYSLEEETISIILGISEGSINKKDIYKDGISIKQFLDVNSEKVTSLNIDGDDYTKTEYPYDYQDFLFDCENNRKINRINDKFIVNYISSFKNLLSLKLKNIPTITDQSLYFLRYLRNIKHVEIVNCVQLSDMCVRNILTRTKLDFLSIENCVGIRPNWKGSFSKYPLFKLYRENEEALKSGKLLEETAAALKKEIAANTFENMKRNKINNYTFDAQKNVLFKTEQTSLSQDDYQNMCLYPTEIILRDYIPAYNPEDGLRRRDVANNIVMNLVHTFPNITRLDLSKTAVTEAGICSLGKLVTLEYLDTRNTNLTPEAQVVCENRIATHDLIFRFINPSNCVESFFFNG